MLLAMMPTRIRVTPLAGYLLALAIYSWFMCLSTLRQQQQQQKDAEEISSHPTEDYDDTRSHQKIHRKSSRGLEPPKFVHVDDFYTWLSSPETSCKKLVRFGGTSCKRALDFDKSVCLDEDVALRPKNCTVYSFGIGHDSTFDDTSSHYGCDVFMFDPTINADNAKKQLTRGQTFYPYGLDSFHHTIDHHVTYMEDNTTEVIVGVYEPYDKIIELIGHPDHLVHYLKVDIENTEWNVIPYLLKRKLISGVKQIAIEIHTMDIIKLPQHRIMETLRRYAKIIMMLRKEGFQRASYRPNLVLESLYHVPGENRSIPTCAEVLFIRRESHY